MVSEVLNQLQFRCVPDKLEELDDEDFDDDEETEWQHYLRASIECIMRVADVFPNDVLRIIVSYASPSIYFFILKLYEPLQRYMLTCLANSAFLGRFFCTGQQ